MDFAAAANEKIALANGASINVVRRGRGPSMMFVHSEIGLASDERFLDLIAREYETLIPIIPGFDGTAFAEDCETIEDLTYLYLDLIKALDLRDVTLVGSSLGGWIAAELAVKSTARISRLILIDPYGIKTGGRETRDIADIFSIGEKELAERSFFDPAFARNDYAALSDGELGVIAQNREAAARYGWSPYMHNPRLKRRLYRIDIPTLLIWGAQDRITGLDYGRAYAQEIPRATLELIDRAGHFPQVEQPGAVAEAVCRFAQNAETPAITGARP